LDKFEGLCLLYNELAEMKFGCKFQCRHLKLTFIEVLSKYLEDETAAVHTNLHFM